MSEIHAQTTAYVRDTMIQEQDPPALETGAVKWIRENLISSWLNAILTALSVYVVFVVLRELIPWFANSVWSTGSLEECRDVLGEQGLGSHDGACFSVITERWRQLMYGFYPSELYWRPILAFFLFLLAIAPVLFASLPRQMLKFSLIAPFIMYWLVWGGSVWGPVFVAIGLGATSFAFIKVSDSKGALWGMLAGIVTFLVLFFDPISMGLNLGETISMLFVEGGVSLAAGSEDGGWTIRDILPLVSTLNGWFNDVAPLGIQVVESNDIGGFMLAIIIGISGIVLSLPLGILLALGRQSDLFIIKTVSVAFIEIIRGVPLIVWLFTASLLLNYFLPPGTSFDLMLRVIIMVTLFSAAYIAEVVRGGLAALPKGQYEAADALGLDYAKSMRLIILPQALKISIPGIVNTFIGLFKDTTLVVFIGLLDPIGLSNAIRATTEWNGVYWELFVFIGLMFFIFCFSMGRYSLFLEKKLHRDHR